MGTSAYFTEIHYEVYFEKPVTYPQKFLSCTPEGMHIPGSEPCFRGRGWAKLKKKTVSAWGMEEKKVWRRVLLCTEFIDDGTQIFQIHCLDCCPYTLAMIMQNRMSPNQIKKYFSVHSCRQTHSIHLTFMKYWRKSMVIFFHCNGDWTDTESQTAWMHLPDSK